MSQKVTETGQVGDSVDIGKSIDEALPPLEEEQEAVAEGAFTWTISNWSELKEHKYVSPRNKIGDFEWDVLLFPQGNHNKGLAIYLEPHGEEKLNETTGKLEPVDPDWYCCAYFAIALSRPGQDSEVYMLNKSNHRFNSLDTDWGFANFIDLSHLKYPSKGRPQGFLNDDQLNITVFVRILKDSTGVLWHNFINYDSKKVTGYVGFKNQGATCYLNSLLQSYYFTKYFRKLVYQIPTENESPNNSVPLALQRSFYQLQVSKYPLDTLELTRSFGWDSVEAFTQHDVQELNRILMDRLENRMKGTAVEGQLNEIFVGKMKSYIKCINVNYESSRVEDFWDLQLNVKGMKGLKESFDNYIEIELLNGENQYQAQEYGLQDAEKGVIFEALPPVLHLQLKRFEYDFNYDQMIKVNDKYEFPESIDLSPYLDQSDDNPSREQSSVYKLHGVLVHAGDISTGHYYTLIKPGLEDVWYRFDDERVWKVTKKQVFDENFGLDALPEDKLRTMTREAYQDYVLARHTSAYMLVYIRADREEDLLQPVTENDVPEHVITRVQEENKEIEEREREIREAHLYVNIRAYTMEDFIEYQGFDLCQHEKYGFFSQDLNKGTNESLSMKVLRTAKLKDLFDDIKEHLKIPYNREVRYWRMNYRRNNTLRPEEIIKTTGDNITLDQALAASDEAPVSSLDIFVEEPYLDLKYLSTLKKNGHIDDIEMSTALIRKMRDNIEALVPPEFQPHLSVDNSDILVFLKAFSRSKQKLTGFGYCTMNHMEKLLQLSDIINMVTGDDVDRIFYEEVQPGHIEKLSMNDEFYPAELGTGDIIAFDNLNENADPEDKSQVYPPCSNSLEFYQYLRHRVKIRFSRTNSDGIGSGSSYPEAFSLWVSAYIHSTELAKAAARYVSVDPEYLKFYAIYANGRFPLKSKSILNDYLLKDYNCDEIPPFEYEVLNMPLRELEHLRSVKLYWMQGSYIHFNCYEFEVPYNCTIDEFLDSAQKKVQFKDEDRKDILLWTNHGSQFQNVLFEDNTFKNVSKSSLVFGRVLPDEAALVRKLEESSGGSEQDINMNYEEDLVSATDGTVPVTDGKLVIVSQYFKDPQNKHGVSFLFNLVPGELFFETKERLHQKFGLGQKEFLKIKIVISMATSDGMVTKPLFKYTDEELSGIILYDVLNNLDHIYLDHPDRLRSHNSADRPMIIK
ncbi:Ubiquitin carboxyl-terminal hydrolase 15 [Nakaseomyces bracarensis]|uniref:ubiquitinyl hydrolase 1 n=1 Tax=Nakaseomyces bracarensis TaxID=273131 RepID=A0ABR4NRJ0_9SACH